MSSRSSCSPWLSKGTCSRTWAACKAARPTLDSGLRKVISSGNSTSFWNDAWTSFGTLRSVISGPLNFQEDQRLVAHFLDSNGTWSWENLSFILPQPLLVAINAIPINTSLPSEDLIAWAPSKDGNFSLKSAYMLAKGLNVLNPHTFSANWIWKLIAPHKILIFLWLCSYNSIPVREVLGSRGFTINQSCPLCNNHPESIVHLLRECQSSVSFWNKLGLHSKVIQSFGLPLMEWLHFNCTCSFPSKHLGIPWKVIFIFGLWTLWLNRNSMAFRGKQQSLDIVQSCIAKAAEFHFLVQGFRSHN
nr:putative ribonuclease h protein [Quercus suber]